MTKRKYRNDLTYWVVVGFLVIIAAIVAAALFGACGGGESRPGTPEPPDSVAAVLSPEARGCLPGTTDTMQLRWMRKLHAEGKILTTYWYDSTGPRTVEGINDPGCLAGFRAYDSSEVIP